VKSHLKHIFEKTGRSRQADLVKLIGEIANPMVG
jgi:DNA-binding CsgD family transcriptional regulator